MRLRVFCSCRAGFFPVISLLCFSVSLVSLYSHGPVVIMSSLEDCSDEQLDVEIRWNL